jgi:hypothetical protein
MQPAARRCSSLEYSGIRTPCAWIGECLTGLGRRGYQVRPDMFPAFFEDFPALADMKARVSAADNIRRVVRAIASRRSHQVPRHRARRNP